MSTTTTINRADGFIKSGINKRTVVDRILRTYDNCPDELITAGRNWYPLAIQFTAELSERTDTRIDTTAAVIAAMSPQRRWSDNQLDAAQFLEDGTKRAGLLGASFERAKECVRHDNPIHGWTGPKISAFFENILGNPECVTVDVWALRAALGNRLPVAPETLIKRAGVYRDVSDAYRVAARRRNEDPRDMQAIVWCAIRGRAS